MEVGRRHIPSRHPGPAHHGELTLPSLYLFSIFRNAFSPSKTRQPLLRRPCRASRSVLHVRRPSKVSPPLAKFTFPTATPDLPSYSSPSQVVRKAIARAANAPPVQHPARLATRRAPRAATTMTACVRCEFNSSLGLRRKAAHLATKIRSCFNHTSTSRTPNTTPSSATPYPRFPTPPRHYR